MSGMRVIITDITPSPRNVIVCAIKVSSPQQGSLMSQTATTEFVNHSPGHICTFIKVKWKLTLSTTCLQQDLNFNIVAIKTKNVASFVVINRPLLNFV